jgi:anti-sigma factor RsiW
MNRPQHRSDHSPRELADLSALADGTLDRARRAEVEATIASSPELTALYERERRVVDLLHESAGAVRAPAGLRARIEASRPRPRVRAQRRVVVGGSLAGALAAAVLAVVLLLPGGTPGAPSISQAAGLATLGPAAAAPMPETTAPSRLETRIEGIYFPNWSTRLHWRASGQRTDHINGRVATTVYYSAGNRTVAYTIVGAPVLKAPAASWTVIRGEEYRTLMLNGRLVVTWRRAGHTCVLSASGGVSAAELQKLASWDTA